MKRREFLLLSGTAALAAAGGALHADILKTPGFRVSIGFAEDGELADARTLYGGDAGFLRDGTHVRVNGSLPPAFELNALYGVEIDGVRQSVPFMAASKGSMPARFVMPVDPDDGVAFELIARSADRHMLRFTVNPKDGAIPLRRGTYVVAVHNQRMSPDWRSLRVTEQGRRSVLLSRFEDDPPPRSFASLLLSFDYPSVEKN